MKTTELQQSRMRDQKYHGWMRKSKLVELDTFCAKYGFSRDGAIESAIEYMLNNAWLFAPVHVVAQQKD